MLKITAGTVEAAIHHIELTTGAWDLEYRLRRALGIDELLESDSDASLCDALGDLAAALMELDPTLNRHTWNDEFAPLKRALRRREAQRRLIETRARRMSARIADLADQSATEGGANISQGAVTPRRRSVGAV